jgi:hypothetical protein
VEPEEEVPEPFEDEGAFQDGDVDLFQPNTPVTQRHASRSESRSRSHVSFEKQGRRPTSSAESSLEYEELEQSRNAAVVRAFLDNPGKLPKNSSKEDIRQMKGHVRRSTVRGHKVCWKLTDRSRERIVFVSNVLVTQFKCLTGRSSVLLREGGGPDACEGYRKVQTTAE